MIKYEYHAFGFFFTKNKGFVSVQFLYLSSSRLFSSCLYSFFLFSSYQAFFCLRSSHVFCVMRFMRWENILFLCGFIIESCFNIRPSCFLALLFLGVLASICM